MFSDKISQRILASFLGLSIFLCSVAVAVFALQYVGKAQANELNLSENMAWDENLRGGVGLGIEDNVGYFVIWGNPNKFYKVDLEKATDWYSE